MLVEERVSLPLLQKSKVSSLQIYIQKLAASPKEVGIGPIDNIHLAKERGDKVAGFDHAAFTSSDDQACDANAASTCVPVIWLV